MAESVRKRILLVEDETILAMTEKMQLEKYGYAVRTVTTGEEAVEAAKSSSDIDLILMDINLGNGIDGTDAAEIILQERDIPIVFLSSHTDPEVVEKTEKITSYGYVVKSSSITVLDASIKMAFKLFDAKQVLSAKEEALLYKHEFMNYVIEHNRSAIAVHDRDLKYLYVSQQYLDSYQVKEHDVIGRHHYEVFPDLPQKWRDVHQKALRGEVSSAENDPFEREDGTIDVTRWECRPWYEQDGTIGGIIVYTEVITERKQTETELAESVQLLSRAQKIAHIGNWHLDLTTNRLWWSDEIYRIFGCEPQEFEATYEAFLDFVHPDDRTAVDRAYTRSVQEGNNGYDIDHRIIRRDSGDVRYVHERCDHERDETGTIIRSLGMVQDITERGQVEEALQESEKRFKHMVNAAPLGIAIVDSFTDEFFLVNPAMSRITGRSVEELERIDWVSFTHPDDIQPDKEKMAELNAGKISGFQLEKRYMHADGHYFWVNITVAPIHVTVNSNPRHVLMVEDITERKQAEEDIQKQLSEKELLLREVHHRVKNNIATIESLLSLQIGDSDSPVVKTALQDTISRVQSTRVLYDKLLSSEDLHEVSIKSYAEGLIDSLAMVFNPERSVIIEKHISEFVIDAKKVFSVGIIINELLTNIFKYAFIGRASGKVSVSIEKAENEVTLTIKDDGSGFDERALKNESPGFGLTVVKMLVEQLGGTYTLSNDNGAKTVVQFEL